MDSNKNPLDERFQRETGYFDLPLSPEERKQMWAAISYQRRKQFNRIWAAVGLFLFLLVAGGIFQTRDSATSTVIKALYTQISDYAQDKEVVSEESMAEAKIPENNEMADRFSPQKSGTKESISTENTAEADDPNREIAQDFLQSPAGMMSEAIFQKKRLSGDMTHKAEDTFTPSGPNAYSILTINGELPSIATATSRDEKRTEAVEPLFNLPYLDRGGHFSDFRTDLNIEKEDKEKNKISWFGELYKSFIVEQTQIEAKSEDHRHLERKWKESIRPFYSMSAGVNAGVMLGDNWSISTGLEYRRVVDKFEHHTSSIDFKMGYNEHAYYYDEENGDRVWVGDSVLAPVILQNSHVAANTHEMLNIPISLAYRIPLDNWSIGLNVGARLSVWQDHEGWVPDAEGDYKRMDKSDYSNRLLSEWKIGVSLAYAIADEWEVFLVKDGNFSLGNRLNEDHPLKKTTRGLHISTGLRKSF